MKIGPYILDVRIVILSCIKDRAFKKDSDAARNKLSVNKKITIMNLDLVLIEVVGWAVTFASVGVSAARGSNKEASASMMKILRRLYC